MLGCAVAVGAAAIALTAPSAFAFAKGGDIDRSFGGGPVEFAMSARAPEDAAVNDGVMQPDGKYIDVGDASVPDFPRTLLLARFDADGSPDPSFGDSGFVTTVVGQLAEANAVAVQPDGKIVVSGSARTDSNTQGLLARYNPDGTLDASFGTDGTVTSLPGTGAALALQPDGRILVAVQGVAAPCADALTIARYNADGSPDASFGSGGIASTSTGTGFCPEDQALAVQGDGKVIVTGSAGGKISVARDKADGSPDASFGSAGVATVDLGPSYLISGVTGSRMAILQPNGRLVLAGAGTAGFALVRLMPDGSLDNSFGSGGIATVATPQCCVVTRAVALQPDGGILFAGGDLGGTPPKPALVARFNADGTLDATFGAGGTSQLDFGGGGDQVANVTLDSTGRVAVLGAETNCVVFSEDCSFVFSRPGAARLTPSGLPDMSFGDGGRAFASPPGSFVTGARNSHPKAVIVQPNGNVLVAGDAYAYDTHPFPGASGFALARFRPDGQVDAGFGDGGEVATSLTGDPAATPTTAVTALRQTDGKIVMVGVARSAETGNVRYALARYEPDGSLDPSFGSGGIVTTSFRATQGDVTGAVLAAGGGIVVAGNVEGRVILAGYHGNGSPDPGFGRGGQVVLGRASLSRVEAIGRNRAGRLLLAGLRVAPRRTLGAVIELNSSGAIRRRFGDRGVADVPLAGGTVKGLLPSGAGGPLVFGRSAVGRIVLFRLRASGGPDRAYDRRARALRNVTAIRGPVLAGTIQASGKLVLAGNHKRTFALVRVRPNGAIDRSFGRRGVAISDVTGRLKAVAAARGRILGTGDMSSSNSNGSNRQTLGTVAAFHG